MLTLAMLGAVLASTNDAPLTVGALEKLRPEAAGRRVLRGREHGTIVAIIHGPRDFMEAPGFSQLSLLEAPRRSAAGCSRQKWSVQFRAEPGAPRATATFFSAFPVTEVALLRHATCNDADFIHVNPGLAKERALEALQQLQDIRTGARKASFSCTDTTASNLCDTPESIQNGLIELRPWAVTAGPELWLGSRGGVVTAVRFSSAYPDEVFVKRKIPAPF